MRKEDIMKQCKDLPVIAVGATEAARMLGISKPTLYRWSNMAGFPAVRIGGTLRFPVKALEEWFNKQGGITI